MRHAIAGHAVNTTYTDVGSADIASLPGCNVLGQCICPWMDGSRTTQEQLSRSYCRVGFIRVVALTNDLF